MAIYSEKIVSENQELNLLAKRNAFHSYQAWNLPEQKILDGTEDENLRIHETQKRIESEPVG